MKNYLIFTINSYLITLCFLTGPFANGQSEKYKKMEEVKKSYLKEKLQLSQDNAFKFWPLYSDYLIERRKLMLEFKEIKKIIRDSTTNSNVAKVNLDKLLAVRQQELNLEKKYVEKFLTVLSPSKVGEVILAEKEFLKILYKKASVNSDSLNSIRNK